MSRPDLNKCSRIAGLIVKWAENRKPDFVITRDGEAYLSRHHVIKSRFFNVYVHEFCDDDHDVPHDHPWWSLSWILNGWYTGTIHEKGLKTRFPGDFILRNPLLAHSIHIQTQRVWTLFITGPHIREWGFYCPKGWVHWKIFTRYENDSASPGCD